MYNQRFPGQMYDIETNLHYNNFRDFDPQLGRYVQSDPIGLAGGINTYAYGQANPLTLVDPDGLQVRTAVQNSLAMPITNVTPSSVTNSVMDDGDGSRSRERESGAEARSRYQAPYHKICDQREPPGLDNCASAKFRLNRAQQCVAAREEYANSKYGGQYDAGHAQQMKELQSAIKNAQKDVDRFCPCP